MPCVVKDFVKGIAKTLDCGTAHFHMVVKEGLKVFEKNER